MTSLFSLLTTANLRRFRANPVFRNMLMLYLVQFSTYLLPLLTLPYLSRVLSTEKYGLIAFAQFFVYYFVIMTDYGFGLTATRQIAIHSDNKDAVSRIFSDVMAARIILMIFSFGAMMAIVFATPRMRANWVIFPLSFMGVLGNVLFPQWLFQGLQKMQHIAYRDITAKSLSLLAIFVFVHTDRDYLIAAGLQSAGLVVAGLISLWITPRVTGVTFRWPVWSGVYSELRGSWPVFLSLAANTTYTSTNTVLLGLVATPVAVAYYSNAFRIIAAIRGLVSPLVTAIYPHISRIASRSNRAGVQFLRRYAILMSAPFLIISIGLFLTAPLAVRVLFGPKYAYSGLLLQVMSLSPFIYAVSHCYCTYFMLAFGYERQWSRLILKTTLVNFLILGPLLFLVSPAMALAITGVLLDLYVAVSAYLLYRKHSDRVNEAALTIPAAETL